MGYGILNKRKFQIISSQNGVLKKFELFLEQGIILDASTFFKVGVLFWRPGQHIPTHNIPEYHPPPGCDSNLIALNVNLQGG